MEGAGVNWKLQHRDFVIEMARNHITVNDLCGLRWLVKLKYQGVASHERQEEAETGGSGRESSDQDPKSPNPRVRECRFECNEDEAAGTWTIVGEETERFMLVGHLCEGRYKDDSGGWTFCHNVAHLACPRCKKAWYCGQECYEEDWKHRHRDLCGHAEQLADLLRMQGQGSRMAKALPRSGQCVRLPSWGLRHRDEDVDYYVERALDGEWILESAVAILMSCPEPPLELLQARDTDNPECEALRQRGFSWSYFLDRRKDHHLGKHHEYLLHPITQRETGKLSYSW